MNDEELEIILPIKDEILMAYEEAASKKSCVNFYAAKYRVPKNAIVELLYENKMLDVIAIYKYIKSGMLPKASQEEIHAHAKPRLTREEEALKCGFSGADTKKAKAEPKTAEQTVEVKPKPSDAVTDALIIAATKYLEEHDAEYKQYAEIVHTCENLMTFIGRC